MRKFILRLFPIFRPFPHTQKLTPLRLTNTRTLIHLLPAVLLFILLLLEPAFAGAPPLQWQKTFGGTDQDYAHSVQQTADGGYIITGQYSFGAENYDAYLIKTDPNGEMQWQKTFDAIYGDIGTSVQQTSDGGYIINCGVGRLLTCDVYLIKTEPNGEMQWQKTFGGISHDTGRSVQQTTDSGYIITGYTLSYGAGRSDVYLIKTDPNGDMQWQKTFGGGADDYGYSVQQTSDGGYIIAGYTYSFGAVKSDVYLIKTDPNGDKKWQKTFGGSESDRGFSVKQTNDGGYIIAGFTKSFGAGLYDVYLIKTEPNGNSQWQKTFGESAIDYGRSVQQTTDGGYIIIGSTGSFGAGSFDVYFIKTDPNGNSECQKTFGGNNMDDGFSVQQTSDGGYIIAGFTESYGAGDWDVYLIKLCPDGTLSADFNCNGIVYYEDLEVLIAQWLQPPGILSADIAPEPGDGIVNGSDFAAFANDWLQTTIP